MRPLAASLAGLLALTPMAALAYDCDALIARMRQAVPAIAPEERKPGEKDRAITLIWQERIVIDPGPGGIDAEGERGGPEPGTEQATLECPADLPPFSERLVSPFQPLANLFKACRRGLLDLAARLAEL